jgi:hypothetical protein
LNTGVGGWLIPQLKKKKLDVSDSDLKSTLPQIEPVSLEDLSQ